MRSEVDVRGGASAEELAAVLAVLTRRSVEADEDGYARWRRTRLAALARRATPG